MTLLDAAHPGLEAGVVDAVNVLVASAEEILGSPLAQIHHRSLPPDCDSRLRESLREPSLRLLALLAGPDAYLQSTPNIRIHRPHDRSSVIPFHSDVLYGHSPDEINYWVNLTPVWGTNSLWLSTREETDELHRSLREDGLSLEEFEAKARRTASPVEDSGPGVHQFCCAQVHGSFLNETDSTRVSLDLRSLGPTFGAGVKNVGGYFRPQWLPETPCPYSDGRSITTVASLDVNTPVYLQRLAMQKFYPQSDNRTLVEFHGLPLHAPTLEQAMDEGPVIAYSIRQLRRPVRLSYPIGFVDERVWFLPGDESLIERLQRTVMPA